jgi:hypothetical protein
MNISGDEYKVDLIMLLNWRSSRLEHLIAWKSGCKICKKRAKNTAIYQLQWDKHGYDQ